MSLAHSLQQNLRLSQTAAIRERMAALVAKTSDPLAMRFGPALADLVRLAAATTSDARRRARRIPTCLAAAILVDGIEIGRCRVTDISAGGARVVLDAAAPVPFSFDLRLSGGRTIKCNRIHHTGLLFGVSFA